MQPQQPPQLSPNPLPSDYLDKIASPPQQSRLSTKQLLFIVGGGLLLVVIFIMIILSMNRDSTAISTERLALRLQTLQKVSQSAHKNIKSSSLRSINSNLKTSLINTNRDIAVPLEAAEINLKKAEPSLIAEENGIELTERLENARLNVSFDSTYAREMSFELERTSILMSSLLAKTRSTSLKAFLQSSIKDLVALQKQFSAYNSANS